MKLKRFNEYKPKIGDWIIMKANTVNKGWKKYLIENPGQIVYNNSIVRVRFYNIDTYKYGFNKFKFLEINKNDKHNIDYPFFTHTFNINKILAYHEDKEFLIKNLDLIIDTKNFNL